MAANRANSPRVAAPSASFPTTRAALLPPQQPEDDETRALDEDQDPVCGREVREVAEPDHRADHAGDGDGDEAPERQGRVARDDHRQVPAQGGPQHDEREQSADPERCPDQMGGDGVDGGLVVGGAGRVAGQGERQQRARSRGTPAAAIPLRLKDTAATVVAAAAMSALMIATRRVSRVHT